MWKWDKDKNRTNKNIHGIGFEDIEHFDWDSARETEDHAEHGEIRINAFGLIYSRVVQICFTWRGETRRIISLRPATRTETKTYIKETYGE